MENYKVVPIGSDSMKTYLFKIVIEEDSDFDGNPSGYLAYCPALRQQGAAAGGDTREEALKNIREVIEMTVEGLIEEGFTFPVNGSGDIQVFENPSVAVTV